MKPLPARRFLPFAVLLALPLLALHCGKQEDHGPYIDPLPAATTTGADTWGCLVYGEVWKNSGAAHIRGDWTTPDSLTVSMDFAKQAGDQQHVYRVVLSFTDTTNGATLLPGTYTLSRAGLHTAEVELPAQHYTRERLVSGVVQLSRVDQQAAIVSGTFKLTMASRTGDTLRLTDGRFDGHVAF